MGEGDYWASLEYRVCRELAGMKDRGLRHLWCDGFVPERYLLSGPEPHVTGRAWVGHGARQAEWTFTLFLPRPVGSRGEVNDGCSCSPAAPALAGDGACRSASIGQRAPRPRCVTMPRKQPPVTLTPVWA